MKVWLTSYNLDKISRLLDRYEVRNVTQFIEKAVMETIERLERDEYDERNERK